MMHATYLERFKEHWKAGTAFRDGKKFFAILMLGNKKDTQFFVATAILAPFFILISPLILAARQLKNAGGAGRFFDYFVFIALVAAPIYIVRLLVTPFTELANVLKSLFRAFSKTLSPVEGTYKPKPLFDFMVIIGLHVWTLGLLLLISVIKNAIKAKAKIKTEDFQKPEVFSIVDADTAISLGRNPVVADRADNVEVDLNAVNDPEPLRNKIGC